jgi:hypothetical protein
MGEAIVDPCRGPSRKITDVGVGAVHSIGGGHRRVIRG